MASPWKFLARLTSWRRDSKEQQETFIDDVKSKEIGSPDAVGLAIGNPANSDAQQDERGTVNQSDAVPAEGDRSAYGGSIAREEANLGSSNKVEATGTFISDDADLIAIAAPDVPPSSSSGKRPIPSARRIRSQKATAKLVEVSLQRPASAPTFSDDARSLDEEITQLREKLTHRLKLQNAQLRFMLKRFER